MTIRDEPRYAPNREPGSAPANALELVTRAPGPPGVVLDLGCGYGAIAEDLRAAGFRYVGLDVDATAVADLSARGFDAATLDLDASPDALRATLGELVGTDRLHTVMALDALEHLARPGVVLDLAADLADAHQGASLVVSFPNVTHFDVGAKLLVGRFDRTDTGLLDDTHLQLLGEDGVTALLGAHGWREVDRFDSVAEVGDQAYPVDAPVVRPGTPLREHLHALRTRAEPNGTTYQFVRRYARGPAAVAAPPVDVTATVVAVVRDGAGAADLAARLATDPRVHVQVVRDDEPWPDAGTLPGRFVVALDAADAPGPDWIDALDRLATEAPGRVLLVGVQAPDRSGAVLPHRFDPLHVAPAGVIVAGAYALPRDALTTMGIAWPRPGDPAYAACLARLVTLCGLHVDDAPHLAAAPATWRDAESDLDAIADELDAEPLLVGPGAWRRLQASRRELLDARTHLPSLRAQLDGTRGELARARRYDVRQPFLFLRRLAAAVRRRLGRGTA